MVDRGMVVHECGVDPEGVADPERIEVGSEGVVGGTALGCEDGEEPGLDAWVIPDHLDNVW